MKYRRAAGVVIYRINNGKIFCLLLHGKFGWDFPHGFIKPGEVEEAPP